MTSQRDEDADLENRRRFHQEAQKAKRDAIDAWTNERLERFKFEALTEETKGHISRVIRERRKKLEMENLEPDPLGFRVKLGTSGLDVLFDRDGEELTEPLGQMIPKRALETLRPDPRPFRSFADEDTDPGSNRIPHDEMGLPEETTRVAVESPITTTITYNFDQEKLFLGLKDLIAKEQTHATKEELVSRVTGWLVSGVTIKVNVS